MADAQYDTVVYAAPQIEHAYGPRVHILADPLALTLLGRASATGVVQPELNHLIRELYRLLVHVAVASEFPRRTSRIETRMIASTPHGVWTGPTIDPDVPAVVVALARAGLLPAQVSFDFLNQVLQPSGVRQDHLALGRTVDNAGAVTGAALGSAKIGGAVEGAVMLIPDPMGATGSTVARVMDHYRQAVAGEPRTVLALHLVVTPEYLRLMNTSYPEVHVYALRVDRGLSPPEVLATVPGTHWDRERGLDEHHYIVPGAGGLGEAINNAWV